MLQQAGVRERGQRGQDGGREQALRLWGVCGQESIPGSVDVGGLFEERQEASVAGGQRLHREAGEACRGPWPLGAP